ncbi:ferric reductase-like transmembrane domain-containing protein [Imperialibacter roseus]|uniref:Ferric reductase-like transmembrane domain-containing protein n=1 Tax=Imperialibacter roseus TaxID=1324217 RepID=A0ABZ0ISN9_9BACT|nr:ferric reductase-like transmembrane domain-containing protein [Imperialibacter roseus]WOK08057.1 ferric reductase-like transmembrane domain-containing protein [Imperialibacter roseus]
MEIDYIEISGIIGLVGIAALALNFIVGYFIWSGSTIKLPYGLKFLGLHKLTGYTAAIAILVHILLLPFSPKSGFTWGDLLLPAWTEHQPLANTFGAVALYVIALVVISSYYKSSIKLKTWRTIHYTSYFAMVPLILHAVITDPKLQDRPIDWFDAEKLFVILCCVVMLGMTAYRFLAKK